ncbi:adhesion G-protein coupled receptor F3-like [Engystomops pustulosus]|uniref:adhesion G-protein coupled receptor F3-like n=1 Tax=Engystomops pustulosus TaxID=76066 RepID=UPI003AFAAF4B
MLSTLFPASYSFCISCEDTDKFCSVDGDRRWKVTKAGHNAEILCPRGKTGRITRSCLTTGQWAPPEDSCEDTRLWSLLEQAKRLNGGVGIPEVDISLTMETLRNYTMQRLNYISHPSDIITVVETIKILSRAGVEYNIQLPPSSMLDFVTVCSRLLSFDLETFWTPALRRQPSLGSMFLQSVEVISRLFETDSSSLMLIQPNLHVSTVVLDSSAWTEYNISFSTTPNIEVVIKNIAMKPSGKITIINMVLMNLGKILPWSFGESVRGHNHSVESHVLINTMKGGAETITESDLHMTFFRMREPNETEVTTAQCVFWDNSLFEGSGGWSTEGCQTRPVDHSVVCRCRHVAPCSVLRSLGVFGDELEEDALEILSQVGASLSIFSLLICFIVYIIEWRLVVKDDITFYRQVTLINISVSRIIADVWFLVSTFISVSHTNHLCISAAFFQHVFYLASLFWMLIQGLILLYELVFTFQLFKAAVIVAMIGIGYICPLIVASVTIGVEYPNEGYLTEGTCFLNREDGAVFAFEGPTLLVVVLNSFTIGAMVWKLLRPPEAEEPEDEGDTKSLVARALACLTSLFGITWFLESEMWLEKVHEFFVYALKVLNSFQGVIILIFGCLLDRRIRKFLAKRFQKLQSLFSSPTCCEQVSYSVVRPHDICGEFNVGPRGESINIAVARRYIHNQSQP